MASDPATGRIVRTNNAAIDKTGLDYDRIQASKNQVSTVITHLTIAATIEALRQRSVPLTTSAGDVLTQRSYRAAYLNGYNAAWSDAFDAGVAAERELAEAERAEAKDAGS